MFCLKLIGGEFWDEVNEEFINVKPQTIRLEHSLVSVSKWESRWHKAFLTKKPKSREETIDYIRCMTLTQNVDPMLYQTITNAQISQVMDYINDPMTATTIRDDGHSPSHRIITSEVIYAWMAGLHIPFECQKWHLNRLITLIQVCGIENSPPKKMSRNDIANRNRSLNAARKKQYGTNG